MSLTLLQAFESALRVAINVLSKSKIIVEKQALLRSNVLSTILLLSITFLPALTKTRTTVAKILLIYTQTADSFHKIGFVCSPFVRTRPTTVFVG